MAPRLTGLHYLQFPIGEWRNDPRVESLSTLARQGLFELILALWLMGGRLPNVDGILQRQSRMLPDEWASCRESILEFFEDAPDGRLTHPLFTPLYEETVAKVEKRKAAANSRWKNEDAHADANQDAKAMQVHMQNECKSRHTRSQSVYESSSPSRHCSPEDFQALLETLMSEHPGSCNRQLAGQYLSSKIADGNSADEILHNHREAQKVWASGRIPPDLQNWVAQYSPDNKLVAFEQEKPKSALARVRARREAANAN